jgi:DNA polymerase-1
MDATLRTVVCDIETDGLNYSKIHIIVCKDIKTNELFIFDTKNPNMHQDFIEFSKGVRKWIGHYFLNFDMFAINKIIQEDLITFDKVFDTCVVSRLFDVTMPSHSLEYWGQLLGYPKQEHEDWSIYTEEMKSRCVTDVHLNHKVFNILRTRASYLTQKCVDIEHEVTYILELQKRNGFALDVSKAQELRDKLKNRAESILEEVLKDFEPKKKLNRRLVPRYVGDGSMHGQDANSLSKAMSDSDKVVEELDDGTYSIYDMVPFNIGSPLQIVERMEEYGWKPVERTKSGNSWKINERNLSTLPDTAPESAHKFVEWRICETRWKMVDEWLNSARNDGRVHADVTCIGAYTHRMSHQNPNMGNLPSTRAKYGHECRSCLTGGDNWLLGCDASGIQLRVLAHYMNDEEYTQATAYGDPHTKNMEAASLPSRDIAKTFIYAWLLGAGDAKIAEIIGASTAKAAWTRKTFLQRTPALARLLERTKLWAKQGYMIGLDGRRLPLKSAHYALSSALQGGEAVIMKLATILWHREMTERGLWINTRHRDMCMIVHDEWQTEVSPPEDEALADFSHLLQDKAKLKAAVDSWKSPSPDDKRIWSVLHKTDKEGIYQAYYHPVGELQVKSLRLAGEILKLNCPIDGEYNLGKNWADTH